MIENFKDYLYGKFMNYDDVGPVITIGEKIYIYVDSKPTVLDEQLMLILDASEEDIAKQYSDNSPEYVFEWGSRYYSRPCDKWNEPIFNPFVNKGLAEGDINIDYVNLGVHGRYELMSGTRDYSDWCNKAKFLGHESLGICEKNTLAGTLSFQVACKKNDIQPIIGETVRIESDSGKDYLLKFYVKNDIGWRNLLRINTIVNIERSGSMYESDFMGSDMGEGLICVVTPSKYATSSVVDKLSKMFDATYFQLDMSEFEYNEKESESLQSLKYWYENMRDKVQPILISDSYYLEAEDARIKKELVKSGVKGEFTSMNQHFKHIQELFLEWEELWTPEAKSDMIEIFKRATRNTIRLAASCDFEINTSEVHLPKYEMTEVETKSHISNDEMIDTLIEDGVRKLIVPTGIDDVEMNVVWERIDYEMSVIRKGDFVSYFLITRDIVNWSNDNGIITGIGRGSAAGCLVSYLLGIVLMNPLDYGLLFERFLNESRLKGSMPDIDIDFPGDRRDEVKRYIEQRFGGNHVASVGTYVTLQLKAAFQEMGRAMNVSTSGNRIFLSKMLDEYKTWPELFVAATERPQIKNLVRDEGDFINNIQLCLNSPKSQGVHACATIIVPKKDSKGNDTTIFDYVPMRKTSDGMLVTEWEGPQMEDAGFLKEDILGVKQLDKFSMIFDLVKEHSGKDILPMWQEQSIPDDDINVFKAFWEGHTSDVFQFSSDGMTKFLRKMKPDSVEDLIAANALYRPGPMGSNAHNDYCDLKAGKKDVSYDWGCENITDNTYGLIVYQEQVMKICQEVGGFTLVEADNVRKAMGKKKKDLLDSFSEKFIDGAVEKGCPNNEAREIWEKMEIFSAYAFNKSHAAAYAKTAYWCQWLKVNYPIQFWTTALTYAKDEKIPPFIGEILEQGTIEIKPPDINSSFETFTTDMDEGKIFWSLSRISSLGEVAVKKILEDRTENGKYFELSEFMERVNVNKTVITNLILSGAFDDMYDIKNTKDRLDIMKIHNSIRLKGNSKAVILEKEKFTDEYLTPNAKEEWFWYLKQKKVSGMAYLSSFQKVMKVNTTPETFGLQSTLVTGSSFHSDDAVGKNLLVGGYVVEMEEKKTRKGDFYARILLDCNYIPIKVTVWPDSYSGDNMKEKLKDAKGKLMFINGKIGSPDAWNDSNTITTVGDGFKGKSPGKTSRLDIVG